ncbi:hypothetical protein N0V84_012313 [Fusarium piperis]|uniref:Uncharacterized protein n=1 Tax=Fusarium piperis TaxID=1435070 RepID=A0A9W8W3N3_9HYPO|nr:hypothetical protein N0V84_012313 [Fusarium piperis]
MRRLILPHQQLQRQEPQVNHLLLISNHLMLALDLSNPLLSTQLQSPMRHKGPFPSHLHLRMRRLSPLAQDHSLQQQVILHNINRLPMLLLLDLILLNLNIPLNRHMLTGCLHLFRDSHLLGYSPLLFPLGQHQPREGCRPMASDPDQLVTTRPVTLLLHRPTSLLHRHSRHDLALALAVLERSLAAARRISG